MYRGKNKHLKENILPIIMNTFLVYCISLLWPVMSCYLPLMRAPMCFEHQLSFSVDSVLSLGAEALWETRCRPFRWLFFTVYAWLSSSFWLQTERKDWTSMGGSWRKWWRWIAVLTVLFICICVLTLCLWPLHYVLTLAQKILLEMRNNFIKAVILSLLSSHLLKMSQMFCFACFQI